MRASPRYLLLALCLIIAASASVHAADDKKDKPATTKSSDQPGPLRFYGNITAIDVNAKTFVVDGKTYTIIAESQMTKAADDKPATLADAVVGEPARGSYTTSSDGKLSVTKVRFGKKPGGGGKSSGKKKAGGATQPAAGANAAPKE